MFEEKIKPVLIVAILFRSRGAVGGMAQRFAVLSDKMIKDGYSVELLTTGSLLGHLHIPKNRRIVAIDDTDGKISISGWIALIGLVMRVAVGRYSHIHVSGGGRLTIPLLKLARFSRTRTSTTFASRTLRMAAYDDEAGIRRWKRILDLVNCVDVLNPGHDLEEWQAKIRVSPGSFPSRYREIPSTGTSTREAVAVFCGALEKTKNPMLAIDAFDRHLKRGGGGRLVVFGNGSMLSMIKERINEVNTEAGYDAVSMGPADAYFSTLRVASAFLSMQDFDNYPSQSLMEAMLVGCRCIATADGDTQLMFPGGDENIVIASRDVEEFSKAISKLFSECRESVENRKFAMNAHSIDTFCDYFVRIIGARKSA